VFLGFRDAKLDFLFKDEWTSLMKPSDEGAESSGENQHRRRSYHFLPSSSLFVAFSRVDPSRPKEYVQEKIEENHQLVYDVLVRNRNGILFISGKSHPMPYQVVSSVEEAITKADGSGRIFGGDTNKIKRFMTRLAAENRIVFDTW